MFNATIKKLLMLIVFVVFCTDILGMEVEGFTEDLKSSKLQCNWDLAEESVRQTERDSSPFTATKYKRANIEEIQEGTFCHHNAGRFSRRFFLMTALSLIFSASVDSFHLPITFSGFLTSNWRFKNSSSPFCITRANAKNGFKGIGNVRNILKRSSLDAVDSSAENIVSSGEHSRACYQEDLSYIHEKGFTSFVREISPSILEKMRHYNINNGTVIDIGCGGGFWINRLIENGYSAIGVDISPSMIEIAKKNAPLGTFFIESFVDYKFPPCRVVTALSECFNYLTGDEKDCLETLRTFFERVYASLEPGGLFIFDVSEPGRGNGKIPTQMHRHGDDWTVSVDIKEFPDTRSLTRSIVMYRKVNNFYRRSEEIHTVRLYKRKDMLDILRRAGFQVSVVKKYDGYAFKKGHVGYIARKK